MIPTVVPDGSWAVSPGSRGGSLGEPSGGGATGGSSDGDPAGGEGWDGTAVAEPSGVPGGVGVGLSRVAGRVDSPPEGRGVMSTAMSLSPSTTSARA